MCNEWQLSHSHSCDGDEGKTMTEEEMISVAIVQLLQAPTPYLAPGLMSRLTPALLPCY